MFKDKVAVVTGAGSGIGRALAVQLAQSGARLALSDVNVEGLAETARQCGTTAGILSARLDVSQRDAVLAHADDVLARYGAAHFLFNNAGVSNVGTVEHMNFEEFEWLLSINLWGVIYGTKAFLPAMLTQREGCIVNISSVFGLAGYPAQGAYNISKFGVRGLTECLWRELRDSGVRAVCVHPGGIATNIERAAPRCAAAGEQEESFTEAAERLLITPPERCARDILEGVRKGRKRIITGKGARAFYWLTRLFPNHYDDILVRLGY